MSLTVNRNSVKAPEIIDLASREEFDRIVAKTQGFVLMHFSKDGNLDWTKGLPSNCKIYRYVEKDQNKISELVEKYNVKAYPTLIVLDGNNLEKKRIEGESSIHEYIRKLKTTFPVLPQA